MKILQIHRYLGAGGIEAMVCGLANEMAKTEDVTVCTIIKPNPTDVFFNKLSPEVKKDTIGKIGDAKPFKEIFKIYRYLKESDFDVVHIHGYFYYYVLAILLLHKRIHFFFTAHNDALMENTPWDLRILPVKKWFFRRGWMHPVTISEVSQDSFYRLYHCDSRLIHNGIAAPVVDRDIDTLKEFRITQKTKVFVHPGRVCEQKNPVVLCKVFDRLLKEGHDIALVMAGPNHSQAIYGEMSKYFSDRIRHIGEHSDIPSLLASADGMCLSSIFEGLPVVVLESLAVGCIPICTPVGGIVNVIEDGQNGILSKSPSEEDYYEALSRYLGFPDKKIKSLKLNCTDSFKNYDISITAGKYLQFYRETLKASGTTLKSES